MTCGFGSARHLARRFFTSLWTGGPAQPDDTWARSFLGEHEVALWRQMSGPDRRHAVSVARCLGRDQLSAVPAALLHDVGKIDSQLGPARRALVTIAALVVGRDRLAGGRGRGARYLRHDVLGAARLADAGSDALTVTWAVEHHLPPEQWTVPGAIGHALKAADND